MYIVCNGVLYYNIINLHIHEEINLSNKCLHNSVAIMYFVLHTKKYT